MRLLSHPHISLAATLLAALASLTQAAPPERTLPIDPVELLAGREVPGKPDLALDHEGNTYLFSTPETKAAFENDPAKYEAYDGGACGRMGPLAGLGDARRYAVHDSRLFFFASDACRTTFLKEPAKYIERDDDKIFGSNEQVEQGRAALDRMLAWAGGAERLRALKAFRATAARKEKQGDTEYAVTNELAIAFPDRYYQKEAWNESWFSTTSGPKGGAMATSRGTEPLAASRERAFRRAMARWPIVILKAHADHAPKADCPGLIVLADGEGALDDTPVEYVEVWLNGAASRLTIEKQTGKLRQLAFRGRDATMSVGSSLRTYRTYATVDGITLPTSYTVWFDGFDARKSSATIDAFQINPELPADRFEIPTWIVRVDRVGGDQTSSCAFTIAQSINGQNDPMDANETSLLQVVPQMWRSAEHNMAWVAPEGKVLMVLTITSPAGTTRAVRWDGVRQETWLRGARGSEYAEFLRGIELLQTKCDQERKW